MSHKIQKFSTKFDDLGLLYCEIDASLQEGKENNWWFEQIWKSHCIEAVPLAQLNQAGIWAS